jgi:hypothetical protein
MNLCIKTVTAPQSHLYVDVYYTEVNSLISKKCNLCALLTLFSLSISSGNPHFEPVSRLLGFLVKSQFLVRLPTNL